MNNNSKNLKNVFNFKRMDIEMIPEEDEERLKTENETGKKFYENHYDKKIESLADKIKENQFKRKMIRNAKSIKNNLEFINGNIQKEDFDKKNTSNITINQTDKENNKKNFDYYNNIKLKLDNKDSRTPRRNSSNNNFKSSYENTKINYNDIKSINTINGIQKLYPYNFSININSDSIADENNNINDKNLKKSNSQVLNKGNDKWTKSYCKLDESENNKKINIFHSKSVNWNISNSKKRIVFHKKDNQFENHVKEDNNRKLKSFSNNLIISTEKNPVHTKNDMNINSNKLNFYKSTHTDQYNYKNVNNSDGQIIKFDNNDKPNFENSFDQISEISIKNNSSINTNYNMSHDKEKNLNESILINENNSIEKRVDNLNIQENNELKNLIDFISKKQISLKKIIINNFKIKEGRKDNMSKNSSLNYQSNTNNSNSDYSKKNAISNSKHTDSVDTDVSLLNQNFDIDNKSKLSFKYMKEIKDKQNSQLNIVKISKTLISDEASNKDYDLLNKFKIIAKNCNLDNFQNEMINNNINNNSIYTNEKSNSSIFLSKIRVKSPIISNWKHNLSDKENSNSFNSNHNCKNSKHQDNHKINESKDILNNNFDFNELNCEENDKTTLKLKYKRSKLSDLDLIPVKFPIFISESTKNMNNKSNLFNRNFESDKTNKDMKLPNINITLNKSINSNFDINDNKNSFINTKILNNFDNSVLKDKSLSKCKNNNSSLYSNRFDFNINSKIDEEIIEFHEKEKNHSIKNNNLKDKDYNSIMQNVLYTAEFQKNYENNLEKNIFGVGENHIRDPNINFVNQLSKKINSSNNHSDRKKLNKIKINFKQNNNMKNKNGFSIKKENENEKKSQPIKLFNMNLNKI